MFIIYLIVFIFGTFIGSFLNCVIYRLEQKKNLGGRSFCPECRHQLFWQDLIPVFSYIFLGGKCRYCKKKISIQYPLIEILTGLVFLLVFAVTAVSCCNGIINLIFLFYIASVFIVIFAYDFKHYLIPDKVLIPAIIIALIYKLFESFSLLPNLLMGVLVGSGFFLLIFLISRGRWIGFGDVKLGILMGVLLGFPNVLVALFLAFLLGAMIGVALIIFQKKGLKSQIPFGPFLIVGTFIALFWGQEIINWYLNTFLLI